MKIFAQPWKKGAIYAFIIGALIAVASFFDLVQNSVWQSVLQFFGSFPVWVTIKIWPQAPEFFIIIIYFMYWILLGALIGWLLTKGKAGKIGIAALAVVLIFAHWQANVALEEEIAAAIQALGNFLREMGGVAAK